MDVMGIKLREKNIGRRAFSVVELVTVLGVMALAVSFLAPFILDARDEMRLAQCADNLRRITLAWNEHEQVLGFYPSSGWGWLWTGDPDRGFGETQPGGWAYDMVRFTEYGDEISQGAGLEDFEKVLRMQAAHAVPVPIFNCPQRREPRTYPLTRNGRLANNLSECITGSCNVTRLDYFANSGNLPAGGVAGPVGDRDTNELASPTVRESNGVSTQGSEIRLSQVTDGLSKTLCVAEKYLNPDNYFNGNSGSDDNAAYSGIDRDNNGYTASASRTSTPVPIPSSQPRRDRIGLELVSTFGSAHQSGFNGANCDGSVKFINYNVNFLVFHRLGGRNDGPEPIATDR